MANKFTRAVLYIQRILNYQASQRMRIQIKARIIISQSQNNRAAAKGSRYRRFTRASRYDERCLYARQLETPRRCLFFNDRLSTAAAMDSVNFMSVAGANQSNSVDSEFYKQNLVFTKKTGQNLSYSCQGGKSRSGFKNFPPSKYFLYINGCDWIWVVRFFCNGTRESEYRQPILLNFLSIPSRTTDFR